MDEMFAKRTQWTLHPNPLTQALSRARQRHGDIIDLTASNPTDCGFDYDSETICNALGNANALRYQPEPFGMESARRAVASYYRDKGIEVSPDDVVLAVSTSELYSYICRLLCDPDDEILVPRPSYPLFEFLADIQDVRLSHYDLFYDHGWHLDAHSLRTGVSSNTRAVVVVSPNNPTGSSFSSNEADQLGTFCSEHQLPIIVDEVFLDYPLEVTPAASWVDRGDVLTFTISGLSKVAALPQAKLAWCVVSGPQDQRHEALRRLEVIADTYLSVNASIQHALPILLQTRGTIQQQIQQRTHENLRQLDELLKQVPACSRLKVDAGWYAILRIPKILTDEELAVTLLEQHGVLVHPGHFYGFAEEGHIILSLLPLMNEFRSGVERLLRLCEGLSSAH